MRNIIALILAIASLSAHADEWTGPDKDKHVIAGLLVSSVIAAATSPTLGMAAGCAVGLAKEVSDRYNPGHQVSAKDAVVTCLGAVVGAYVPGLLISNRMVGFRMVF